MINNLIQRLRDQYGNDQSPLYGISVVDEAANAIDAQAIRIAELEKMLKNDNLAYRQGLHDGREESACWEYDLKLAHERAEKAEAAYCAARDALRYFSDSLSEFHGGEHHDEECPDCRAMIAHAPAIAAARREQPSPDKSCETRHWWHDMPRSSACTQCVEFSLWKTPKSDVCLTCDGKGYFINYSAGGIRWQCRDCDGTGKKETK